MDKRLLSLVLSLSFVLYSPSVKAVQVNLTEKDVQEAVGYGERYSRTIFNSSLVAPACFGYWPGINGGLVRSKFIDIAVKAAMRKAQRQAITKDDIKEVMNCSALRVMVRTRDDVAVSLKQGGKVIEPAEVSYKDACCELCELFDYGADKTNHEFVTAGFPYSELDPASGITIIIRGPDVDTQEYRVSLSKIR